MSFAQKMNLRPADVVIVPKSGINLVEHYLIYGGVNYFGEDFYYENIQAYGVRTITDSQFCRDNPRYKRIRRFTGNEYQRSLALKRAQSLIGTAYSLTKFNCEDYANYVQYNTAYSKQTNNAGAFAFVAILVALVALASGEASNGSGRRK